MKIKLRIRTTEIIKPDEKKDETIEIYYEGSYIYLKNSKSPAYIERTHTETFDLDTKIDTEDEFFEVISAETGYDFVNEDNELTDKPVITMVSINDEIHWMYC